ncbi:prolyl oligopeptidase family protein [Pusillimonas sp.]|uniref:prolyl oligopeptidase family protein n=1 Tax=Pusillimonas sp. TaxID=3040095 RepID=UPI0037CC4A41
MIYPHTPQGNDADEHFGQIVADPYRWLENDISRDLAISDWVGAQNKLSTSYLTELPGRAVFQERLAALFDHERLTTPEKRRGRYFFTRNSGLDNQAVLFVREGVDGSDRVVIDPNEWSSDGATALAEWAPSEDGRYLAYAIQEGGSDWRTVRVLEVDSGKVFADEIKWARFTSIAWTTDSSGFFYSRNSEPEKGTELLAPVKGHAVYFHQLGTKQADDRLLYTREADFPLIHTVEVTADGRYAVIYSTALTGGNGLALADLSSPTWPVRSFIDTFDHAWVLIGNIGTTLFLHTQDGAERGRIVTTDCTDSQAVFRKLIAERHDKVLRFGALVGNRLIVSYMHDAKTEIERYKIDGTADGVVELPGVGSAGAFHGRWGDDEAFFVFTSHDAPTTIYRYNVSDNTKTTWAQPKVAIDLSNVLVEQHFYASKDDTQVPVFVVRRADVTAPAATMLTAYGGFGISMVPFYSPAVMAWVEQGGVYAVANIRGGGEYGKAWHDAGRGQNKQNSVDDFIAAGEFLKRKGLTSPDGLAIHGESNGGLLIGAVVNQRPDLFAAALVGVGVLDMLRFNRFTGGQFWAQEFGRPDRKADFQNLFAYSPLHNIRPGTQYPAILVTTADTDDRVVPAHSFKYVATLQYSDLGAHPHLLRVETRAGHGTGKPTDKAIDEVADMWAFAAHWSGLVVGHSE